MKNLGSKAIISQFIFTAILWMISPCVHAVENTVRLGNPFLLPQTNFFIGNVKYRINLSNSTHDSTSNLDAGGINTYGFELEVNQNSFLNIGAYFRVESQKVETTDDINKQFSTLLGGFTRFFYMPSFLDGKSVKTRLFARLEAGGGPTFLGGPSGLVLQGGAHVGVETYFNRWLGLSLSYGQVIQYGRETIINGDKALQKEFPQYENAMIWNQGQMLLLSLKTTIF